MTPLRRQIVDELRTWNGTPFHLQGRTKGRRVDCIGLGLVAADLAGVTAAPLPYRIIPHQDQLRIWLDTHLDRISDSDAQPGDVVLLRYNGRNMHVGILTDWVHGGLGLIHANMHMGCVREHEYARNRLPVYALYRFKGLEI